MFNKKGMVFEMRKKYSDVEKRLMKEMAFNLKKVLDKKHISQKELAQITGLSTSAISDYVNAKTLMSPGNVQIISDALDVKKSEIDPTFRGSAPLFFEPVTNLVNLPIVGKISCGNGMLAFEEVEGYESTPKEELNGVEHFYLRAKGDSMNGARIHDGDLLLIRKQEEVEDGEIAAVLLNDEAVLKRVYKRDGTIILHSENQNYPPIIANEEVKIIGKLKKIVITL